MRIARLVPLVLCGVVGCGGKGSPKMDAPGDMAMAADIMGEHGIVVDYFSGMPLAGMTVTEGANSVTTGADGSFVLPATTGALLQAVVTGTGYVQLYLPDAVAASDSVNRGNVPMATTQTFALAQQILANDTTKALVYVEIAKTGACSSIAGGTLTVTAPAGVSVAYFSSNGLPTGSSFIDLPNDKPVAVLYNVTPGADIQLSINGTSCTMVAQPTIDGQGFNGHVQTFPTEPGDVNSSLVYAVQ